MKMTNAHSSLICLWLLPLLLAGCMSRGIPQAGGNGEQPAARAILQKSAEAHGLAAFRQIDDISVAYAGEWYGLVSRMQPTLIDAAFRQGSEERILFKGGPLLAQRHLGAKGRKQVIRRRADVHVFYNEVVDGRPCLTLVAVRQPGHGLSAEDRYLLFIDAENHLLRRIRFTMEGLASTQGAVAEVDFFDHREIAGVNWPTRFYERLRKPIPNLPVHDWRLIGLDVNRGLTESDISGPTFSAKAAEVARRIE